MPYHTHTEQRQTGSFPSLSSSFCSSPLRDQLRENRNKLYENNKNKRGKMITKLDFQKKVPVCVSFTVKLGPSRSEAVLTRPDQTQNEVWFAEFNVWGKYKKKLLKYSTLTVSGRERKREKDHQQTWGVGCFFLLLLFSFAVFTFWIVKKRNLFTKMHKLRRLHRQMREIRYKQLCNKK